MFKHFPSLIAVSLALCIDPAKEGRASPEESSGVDPRWAPDVSLVPDATAWIKDERFAAFKEPPLGQAEEVSDPVPWFRFFVDLNQDNPVLIKWYPHEAGTPGPDLWVKQLGQRDGKWTLLVDKAITISPSQRRLLLHVLGECSNYSLPCKDWQPRGLYEDCWIAEIPVPNGFRVCLRLSQMGNFSETVFKESGISIDRLAKETSLSNVYFHVVGNRE